MVVAFDLPTWILIITTCSGIPFIFQLTAGKLSKTGIYECLNESYQLYFSILEQSSNLFQKRGKRRTVLFCLPFAFLILSNTYKGDNITNLTLEPSLVPFDTFKSLIQNNFKTLSRRCEMPDDTNNTVFTEYLGLKTKYVNESKHEAYPIISEILA